MSKYLEPNGTTLNPASLKMGEAIRLWSFLVQGLNPYAKPVECLRGGGGEEIVVLDVDIEVAQVRVHDIRPTERIAVVITQGRVPEVLSLRGDFPWVPHVNPTDQEFPRSLCLYDENPDELSLRWTPANFIERLRWWLAETAKGTLHGEDQPLEPILLGGYPSLILPEDLLGDLQKGGAVRLNVIGRHDLKVFRAFRQLRASGNNLSFAACAFLCPPHVHGVIRRRPRSLAAVDDLLGETGFQLTCALAQYIQAHRDGLPLTSHMILIVILPKKRKEDLEAETFESWAFLLGKPVSEIGEALGVWQMQNGIPGHILGGKADRSALEAVPVDILNPTFELSRSTAAKVNGTVATETKITVIGMGALGSQVADNLVRSGFGCWTPVDPDFLLPHNVARHELSGDEVGIAKAEAMRFRMNSILSDSAPMAIEADVLRPGEHEEILRSALAQCEVVLDFSASQSVSCHLAIHPSVARTSSIFLNPAGTDLIILCEDSSRNVRLDALEFQYYRAVISEPGLGQHFYVTGERVRYARSCRDLTSRVPQHLICLHSGIAAGILPKMLASEEASAGVWSADASLAVTYFPIEVSPVHELTANGWTIVVDDVFLLTVAALRKKKSKKETGGVLLGFFDQQHKKAYIVATIPSPPDSEEWPTLYIRGCEGLKPATDEIMRISDGQIQYIGEWHSHPDRHSTQPSEDDSKVFSWLTEHMAKDGLPPLMMIAGRGEFRIFVSDMENAIQVENPLQREPQSTVIQ